MAVNGERMILVRCDDYLVGVADSSEMAAQMISDYGVGDVYALDYIEESMGLGYTDYEVYYRDLIGDTDSNEEVFIAFSDDISDQDRKVLVCGSHQLAVDTLSSELDVDVYDIEKETEDEDGNIKIYPVVIGELYDDLNDIGRYDL